MYGILLAEDEKWVRVALKKVIEKAELPFTILFEAKDGMEAADWIKLNHADLLLTDIRMPTMDGVALLEDIRERGLRTDVVIVSGHDDFDYTQKAIRLGAFDYLLKPVETDTMKSCLQRWLDRQQIDRANETETAPELDPRQNEPSNPLSPIEIVIRHIHTSIHSPISLMQAAEMAHLNPSYFSKLFKQQTGVNFSDYVITVRMKEAARLLVRTTLRISEISEKLSYADIAYFSNTFKKIMGQTPSDYRKQHVARS